MEGVFIVKLINLVLNMYFPLHLISSRVGLNRIFVEKFHIYQESCRIPDRWIALQSSPMQLEDDVQKHNMMKFYDCQLGNVWVQNISSQKCHFSFATPHRGVVSISWNDPCFTIFVPSRIICMCNSRLHKCSTITLRCEDIGIHHCSKKIVLDPDWKKFKFDIRAWVLLETYLVN